jgi:serine protease Do
MLVRLFLFLALIPGVASGQVDRARFIRLAGSLVKIEAINPEGTFQLGTGVTVAADRVVTNCHVTQRAQRIHVARGGLRWRVTSQLADVERDLCLLRVPQLEAEPAQIGSARELALGQPVGALGFEGGQGLQYREGVVRALHSFDGANIVQSTTAFTSGASGGGLFDANGRLIAILTFRLRGTEGHYFSVPVDWVSARIGETKDYVPVAPMPERRPFWQRAAKELPFFMQANSLAVDKKWADLLDLTARWANAEQGSAEACYVRGEALLGLTRRGEALEAFEQAISLAPSNTAALYNIALIHAADGRLEQARNAVATLRPLNDGLAQQLEKEIQSLPYSNANPKP